MALTKIGSIGINTGIQFAGVTTIATLNGSDSVLSVGGTVNFVSDVSIGGTVSIAGTLTYEDVTNIDAVGLITARNGIVVGSGITLSKDGDGFFTGVTTATTFVGNLTGTASANAVLTGSTNNTLVTVTGANAIQGESDLQFDGAHLTQTIAADGEGFNQTASGNHYIDNVWNANRTISESAIGRLTGQWNGTEVASMKFIAANDTTNKDNAHITFHTATSGSSNAERVRIDSEGRLLIGHTAPQTINSSQHRLQIIGTDYATSGLSLQRFQADSSGASILLAHSRNGTIGSQGALQAGDELGKIRFIASDGTDLAHVGAQIVASAVNNFAENDVPTKLEFSVTADDAATPTVRMTITETGVDITGECEADSLDINGATNPVSIDHTGGNAMTLTRNSRYLAFNANYGGSNTHSAMDTDNAKIAVYIGGTRKYNFGAGDISPESDGNLDLGGTTQRFQNFIGKHLNLRQDRPKVTLNCTSGSTIQPKGLINFESVQNDNEEDMYRINFWEGTAGADTGNPNASIRYNGSTSDGGDGAIRFANESGTRLLYMNRLGNGGTSGAWSVGSDQRKKENITTVSDALTKVSQLRGVDFNWRAKWGGHADSGVIAQEVESVLPNLVLTQEGARDTDADGNSVLMKHVNYNGLWGVMIEAVKELKSKNEALEARIAALEG